VERPDAESAQRDEIEAMQHRHKPASPVLPRLLIERLRARRMELVRELAVVETAIAALDSSLEARALSEALAKLYMI